MSVTHSPGQNGNYLDRRIRTEPIEAEAWGMGIHGYRETSVRTAVCIRTPHRLEDRSFQTAKYPRTQTHRSNHQQH